ncbi:hypothetical protein FisN_14Hh243 [Fistulifera solaris]|uniref:DDT domain-containing protein n=1 Tax=Fistulifera solaris TaxID=1519565 RepID=A0A1Z5K8K7_FISSO|nr:hypothetical protein FisN_14Hh243 [Fistulifera solaris]|eukprot:GAX22610.1 hypothetical protein FisN_14Hh243 [Fistulifera solaris]
MAETPDDKEKKRKKQYKRMGKILAAAWEWDSSFQDKDNDNVEWLCLTDVGQSLDQKAYRLGRHGWEDFARDVGSVYHWHIHKKTALATKAKSCIKKAKDVFAKVDESLAKIVTEYVPKPESTKKRKTEDAHHHSPNKKSKAANKNSELAEREERAMELLATFIEERRGQRSQVSGFSARVTRKSSGGKFDTNFFNEAGRRFRSMLEVGRFLGLVTDERSAGVRRKSGTSSSREQEAEKKAIRKELDKLRKTLHRAQKALDDFVTERKDSGHPQDSMQLADEDDTAAMDQSGLQQSSGMPSRIAAARTPDIERFPGLPDGCIPDVLMTWNFLCTFERAVNLTPVSLDDFVDALTYMPPAGQMGDDLLSPPVYLAEAHLGLLKLLLEDRASDDWWWSVLESDETDLHENLNEDTETGPMVPPPIKVDMLALLQEVEDPLITTSWLSALEAACSANSNDRKQFRESIKTTMKLVTNKWALAFLRKALSHDKSSNCEFAKKAARWLCRRFREARPDLTDRTVKSNDAIKAREKVAEEISKLMDDLPESVPVVGNDDISDTEYDDDDDSDDDSDDEDVDQEHVANPSSSIDDSQKAASSIPPKPLPTFVDMLLPPAKPNAYDEFVNAFSWPHLVGATLLRILHRKRRILNEVDDSLRDKNQCNPLVASERRERERIAVARVLTECIESVDHGSVFEKSINHLCNGGNYITLSALERLCILRGLIEAAYDSVKVNDVVIGNYKQRMSAMKALEMEQRRAKKEAKEKAAADEAAAREQLAAEAREKFLDEKREEILKLNEKSKEFSDEVMESLTDEDIIEFDEDIKADYDALPSPESFNKAEVNEMVKRLQEAAAFDTESLRVVTMEELVERERLELEEMEAGLSGLGGEDALHDLELDRDTFRSIERLVRDIAKAKALSEKLPGMRAVALDQLKDAIVDGTMKVLRSAIASAKKAKLTGPDDETGGIWAVDIMRDAALELDKAKQNKRVFDAQKDLIAKRNKCFIRCEPIGQDRFGNCFWTFNAEEAGHIWVETEYNLVGDQMEESENPGFVNLKRERSDIKVGAEDMESDFLATDDPALRLFSRQEYHSAGFSSSLVKRHWGCHLTEESLRSVIKMLDSSKEKEQALKAKLKDSLEEIVESSEKHDLGTEELEDEENGDSILGTNHLLVDGDEDVLQAAKKALNAEITDSQMICDIKSAIGLKIRVRLVVGESKDSSVAKYEDGEVLGWLTRKYKVESQDMNEEEDAVIVKIRKIPVWKVRTARGKVVWLDGVELLESFLRSKKRQKEVGYFENDSSFLAYRNHSGRHCGKASEAPYSASPIFLARWMVKRESELYPKLKIRSYDNTWGGKSGARNEWTNQMKDFAYDFATTKQGLLTLEQAFFELTLGFSEYQNAPEEVDVQAALDDPTQRIEIELESIEKSAPGLWNTPLSRAVFIEIVSKCTTTGFLALAFDLLCRNTLKYLQRHRLLDVRPERDLSSYQTFVGSRTTRRMNAWQQQQDAYYE